MTTRRAHASAGRTERPVAKSWFEGPATKVSNVYRGFSDLGGGDRFVVDRGARRRVGNRRRRHRPGGLGSALRLARRPLVGAIGVELDPNLMAEVPDFLEERAQEVGLEPEPDVAVRGAEPQHGSVERQELDRPEPHIVVLLSYPRSKPSDGFVPKERYGHSPFDPVISCGWLS